MLVLDASAACDLLLGAEQAGTIARALDSESDTIHAPGLFVTECLNVVRRRFTQGEMDAPEIDRFITELFELNVHVHQIDESLALRISDLFDNVTAMDAAYVVVAEALDATLVTVDKRLAKAAAPYCGVAVVD